jgi:hypothetical protein
MNCARSMILRAMAEGPATAAVIRAKCGLTHEAVYVELVRMYDEGLARVETLGHAEKTSERLPWALTDRGEALA